MNFVRFPANTTNIFPIANSKTGGQLLTEFNLRSRESVMTTEEVKYFIGPSYCHALEDFYVRLQEDELGVAVSSTAIEITSGRALVNGHYVESLTNVVVDLAEANKQLKSEGLGELKGRLAIGLRAMYSTEQTLAASLRVEDKVNMMTGIQIVILPVGQISSGYFVLPQDSPDNDQIVTAHLKLAEFYYINGQVRSIEQNSKKIQAIPASRVGEFDRLLSEHFVTKDGLNPKKIYTMAGKSEDGSTILGKPTWCDSTDSMFIWERASDLTTINYDPQLPQAEFGYDENEVVNLTIPHKYVDGGMWNAQGQREYYAPRVINLPKADFANNLPGTVSSEYTKSIKAIKESINNFYHFPGGKQRAFVDEIETQDGQRVGLPTLNTLNWSVGDYVLVRKDNSVIDGTSGLLQAPSTIYVVLPPIVSDVAYAAECTKTIVTGEAEPPIGFDGVELAHIIDYYSGSLTDDAATIEENLSPYTDNGDTSRYKDLINLDGNEYRGCYRQISSEGVYAYGIYEDSGQEANILLEPAKVPEYPETAGMYDYQDYFCIEVQGVPVSLNGVTVSGTKYYYYKVISTRGSKEYSEPILLTGTIPLATEDTIGGFLNVPDTALDNGYVFRDDQGYLRVLDYSLLRSGVLAYQLGQDYDFGTGLSLSELQVELDEYVNERVAFPTEAQIQKSKNDGRDPNLIEVILNLSEEDVYQTLTIKNIDSRWDTALLITLTGKATKTTTINIENCQKLKLNIALDYSELDLQAGYGPTINLYNTCLYYDASVIEYIHKCPRTVVVNAQTDEGQPIYDSGFNGISNLSLWYQKYDLDDPNLLVSGMTITEVNTPIIPEEYEFWSEAVINDNHYYYGLQSITLNTSGNIVGCGLYLRNDMSANIEFSKTISVAKFSLPQGSNLTYPVTGMNKQLKITGSFVTAYSSEDPLGYITMVTQFTALTQKYIDYDDIETGTISFFSDSQFINDFISIDGLPQGVPIDGWESNGYHVFNGWTIG